MSEVSVNGGDNKEDAKLDNDNLNQLILLSIANLYYSMHLINLKENTVTAYSARNQVKDMVKDNSNASEMMKNIITLTITPEHLDDALSFTDLVTLPNRMKGKKQLLKELKGNNIGWIIASFITVETDEDDKPVSVVFTTRSINDEKENEARLINRSNTDELTGFFNRRAYEDDINENKDTAKEDDFVYVSLDVNGLKIVNDSLGHTAGDELLTGASECMRRCLGPYGRIYRTGGDEFAAIIFAGEDQIESIKNDLKETTMNWSGEYIDGVSIACGFVSKRETNETSVRKIAVMAEERMYADKTLYYQSKGVDRRGQKEAHAALHNLYTKILKINLTEDNYQVVNMDLSEQSEEKGFSTSISTWLRNFATSGQVHPEDMEEYLKLTDSEYIKDYFTHNKTSLSVFYRRNYDGVYKQVMMEIIPAKDYSKTCQTFYLYVKDIDR